MKVEQRKVKGRSEDQIKDLRKSKQHSWLSPICIGQAQGEEKKHIKGGTKALSLSLPRMRACTPSLSLSLLLPLSLPPSLSPPPRAALGWHALRL